MTSEGRDTEIELKPKLRTFNLETSEDNESYAAVEMHVRATLPKPFFCIEGTDTALLRELVVAAIAEAVRTKPGENTRKS